MSIEQLLTIGLCSVVFIIIIWMQYKFNVMCFNARKHTRMCRSLKMGDQIGVVIDNKDYLAIVMDNYPEKRYVRVKILANENIYKIEYSEITGLLNE